MSTLIVCVRNPAETAALNLCRRAVRVALRRGLNLDGIDTTDPDTSVNRAVSIADSFSRGSDDRAAMLAVAEAFGDLARARPRLHSGAL